MLKIKFTNALKQETDIDIVIYCISWVPTCRNKKYKYINHNSSGVSFGVSFGVSLQKKLVSTNAQIP